MRARKQIYVDDFVSQLWNGDVKEHGLLVVPRSTPDLRTREASMSGMAGQGTIFLIICWLPANSKAVIFTIPLTEGKK